MSTRAISAKVIKFPNPKELKLTIRIATTGNVDSFLHIAFVDPGAAKKRLEQGQYASVGKAELHVGGHRVASYGIERMVELYPLFHVTGPLENGRPVHGESYTVTVNDLSFDVTPEEAGRLIDLKLFDAFDPTED